MDVIIKDLDDYTRSLTYKVIGGIFDFRFFINDRNPVLVMDKFHEYLGPSAIPPFWSLGFHQCRWGYQNIAFL
jgi:alpha-glucosidase (family GH31 glycosyl hydrolase)